MDLCITHVFNGISYGALLFLLAGGLSLIFGMMRIVNMTHGSYYLLGGYVGLTVIWQSGHFLLAILAGAIAIALLGIVEWGVFLRRLVGEYKVPMLYPVIAADDLTQRKPAKWVVRTGWTASQPSHPFEEWVYKTLGYKKVAVIAIDYAFGWEVVGGFQKTFEEAGRQIVQKLWPPSALP